MKLNLILATVVLTFVLIVIAKELFHPLVGILFAAGVGFFSIFRLTSEN